MIKTLALGAAATLASLSVAWAAPVNIRIGHVLTEDSMYHVAAEALKTELEKDGEFAVQIFPGGQLGGELKMIQATNSGAIDIVITGAAPVENVAPAFSLLSMPYLFEDLTQANAVLGGDVGQFFLDQLEPAGLHGLGFMSSLERNLLSAAKPVRSLEDLQGMKIRVIQGPAFVETYKALGTQPTPMSYTELYLALQSGVVDGAEGSPDTTVSDRFVEVIKSYSLTKATYMPSLMIMSGRKFDSLTDAQKEILANASKLAASAAIDHYVDGYQASLNMISELGVEVIDVDRAPFAEAAKAAWPTLMASVPDAEAIVDRIEAAKAGN